ncbi:hypothetical protein L596_023993 [Steinernema carpocapsae]|uniref:Single-stranded DNA-binding protein n=1 Tax=Steinernema carpocapsae TaxID=34508 RepID=A0A4U5MFD9_STECR|nr:hypothetical protein L596_023993 [Steinernema carpocapsae]
MLKSCVALPSSALARQAVSRAFSVSAVRANESVQRPDESEVQGLFNADRPKRRYNAVSMNRVELIGGVAAEPIQRTTRGGRDYVLFNLITNRNYERSNSGERVNETEMHAVTAFGNLASVVANRIEKGTRVFISGRLHYEEGQMKPDGSRGPRSAQVVAELIQPLARKPRENNEGDQ